MDKLSDKIKPIRQISIEIYRYIHTYLHTCTHIYTYLYFKNCTQFTGDIIEIVPLCLTGQREQPITNANLSIYFLRFAINVSQRLKL